jgi:hypothetical protein
MKYALSLVLLLSAGGCGVKTLGAEDFLYAYRCGSMPGEMAMNSSSAYLGRRGEFQVVELRSGRPADTFVYDISGMQKIRCRADLLPSDFPTGFETLRGRDGFENAEDTRQYVKDYLTHHGRDPGRSQNPPIPDLKGLDQ